MIEKKQQRWETINFMMKKWNVFLVLDSAKAQSDSSFWSSNMLGNSSTHIHTCP